MLPVRVLILTQWFDPEPTFKGLAFARGLKEHGFDVEVLTGFPNYPGGRIYSGYKVRPLQREIIDGIVVTRVPLYASHDQSALRRIFNYISFCASATIGGLFLVKRPDVIYAYHPPLTVGVAAVLIRLFRRSRLIYDIQDMWPDTLRATGMLSNEKILSIVGRVCSFVYRHVDVITVLSPGFRRLLIERGVPGNKIELIYNWCDEGALVPSSNAFVPFSGDERFCVLFAGNMGRAQALDSVIDAYADRLEAALQRHAKDKPGAGAAGGLGYALQLLGAKFESGAQTVARLTGLADACKGADWLITGEGRSDAQTLLGKTPFAAAQIAREYGNAGLKATLLSGGVDATALAALNETFNGGCFSIVPGPMALDQAVIRAPELLANAADAASTITTTSQWVVRNGTPGLERA